ncbi:gamma-aminobutyric acid type B receptor subunit 1-like [Mercenaria mercenaria]|uniref:gamma-aminobutyric acid type B receptor subunit 1-like n=1 Tax=Mercenaria mercenaria TaxID=6596 RepID=UPI00234E96EF|nr:gamma-aminobutyric acid type B receptor subunit 1-like [Mercenaria mercenaria]
MTGGWSGGGPCLQALQMSLNDINAREDILTDFELKLDYINTKCSAGTALYRMFDKLNEEQAFVMIIGDGCSVVSEVTAQVTHLWNLTQLSYGSVSPVLADRERFPKFFRLSTPDQKHNAVRIALMEKYNWKKVATINQALDFFSAVIEDFVKRVHETDITILSQEIFTADPMTRVQNLKDHDARIIVTAMYEDKARALLCAAFKVGLYGPKIVWIFTGWYSQNFWKEKLENIDCTEKEMVLAVEGAFLSRGVIRNPTDEKGIANITANEFDDAYFSHPEYNMDTNNFDFIAPQCYDTMWVAAAALDCTVQNMQKLGHQKTLDSFTYADGDINDILFDCLENTTYTGVSGNVVFEKGDPDKMIKLERIQDGKRVHIGFYRLDKNPVYFEWLHDGIKWKDNAIPRDSTLITYEEIQIPLVLSVSMIVLAVCGNCLTLAFFAFNVLYRKNSYVKMSSPNINNVLLLGCVLCYCTVFFKTTGITSDVICKVVWAF